MTTLQTADGRLLRASRPDGAWGGFGQMAWQTPPMWSDGERWGGHGPLDGRLVSYEAIFREQPVLAAVINKLARRIATLPFDSYRRKGDLDREELPSTDSLESLIEHPLPRVATTHMNLHIAQSLLLHGNALVAKVRGADREAPPVMLWPLDWSRVNAYGPIGGRIEWWSTTQFDMVERFIAVEDTIHFAWPAPSSEIGVSPLEQLGVTVKLEDAAQRYQTASFRNGNRPSLGVTVDSNITKQNLEIVRDNVRSMHEGVDNAAKTFFMGPGVTLQPLSMSPVEAALIEQRRLNREEVGMVYDLAGPLMNDMTHATYSNVAELTHGLYRDVIPPWTTLIEQTFQAQLIDAEPAWLDRFVCFDFTDKLKGEPQQLAETLKLQVEAGLITRNEARRVLNMPPVDDEEADRLFINANNQAPIDYHRNTEVLTDSPAGTEVNPPTGPVPPPHAPTVSPAPPKR